MRDFNPTEEKEALVSIDLQRTEYENSIGQNHLCLHLVYDIDMLPHVGYSCPQITVYSVRRLLGTFITQTLFPHRLLSRTSAVSQYSESFF